MPAAIGAIAVPFLGALGQAVVGGAILGAAIGGITAAITGGDIGKGILFGAIGGAVVGGVTHGLSAVMDTMKVGAQATYQSGAGGTMFQEGALVTSLGEQGGVVAASATDRAAYTLGMGATETAKEGVKSGFMSKLGDSLSTEFGVAAVGQGIGALGEMYTSGKTLEAQAEQAELNRQIEREKMRSAERIAGIRASASGGSSGGAQGPDYTIDELILRDRKAAEEERTSILAKVGAELDAQKQLKNQEFGELAAARGRASEGASVSTGSRTGSRSTETLADIQDRIRAGENAAGDPNTAVVPDVEYVPPVIKPEDVTRTA